MDGRLIVLKRVFEALGEESAISSIDDRKRLQKAVYLGQVAGVDLGYRYSWYIRGPYSTALTQDYYAMAAAEALGEVTPDDMQLKDEIRGRLTKLRNLLEVPESIELSKADWLELLASWHYLRKVNRLDDERAIAEMNAQKPQLVPYAQIAAESLQKAGLLQ